MPSDVDALQTPPPDPWMRVVRYVFLGSIVLVGGVSIAARLGLVGDADLSTPTPSAEPWPSDIPTDPPLSPQIRDLMRRGDQSLRDGRLPEARMFFLRAWELERNCFTCYARMQMVETIIVEKVEAAIREGHAMLEEGRYKEAIQKYEQVTYLVPDPNANYHLLARQGIQAARNAQAKRRR